MLIEDVVKLPVRDRFLYWCRERFAISKKRQAGKSRPWTDDVVLQQYFFTNPYREMDKTTVWFKQHVRDPLRIESTVLMATVIFRWFNLPETGHILMGQHMEDWDRDWPRTNLLVDWSEQDAVSRLNALWNSGANPVFTGGFMIKAGNGPRGSKIPSICQAISNVWNDRAILYKAINGGSMKNAWEEIMEYPFLGGFMAYEIVCDLRYTHILEHADDKETWCNQGPGAIRGMNRIHERPLQQRIPKKQWAEETQQLLKLCHQRLRSMPRFEMREVEHSLCEFFKYEMGLLWQTEGHAPMRLKRRYNGM